jgi:hypothetical protein
MGSNKGLTPSYALIVVDNHSRDTWINPLRRIKAITVCEALFDIFSHTSLPLTVSTDMGSVICSKLYKEFMNRLHMSPLFTTPLYQSADGLSERHTATVKSMINRAAHENPKSYTRILPLITWFLRETPCPTTGVASWTLCHGFAPTGTMELVKQNWSGEIKVPPEMDQRHTAYLSYTQSDLNYARKYTEEIAMKMQDQYEYQYNLRSRPKAFQLNDLVLVLLPSSANRSFSQWHGPARIV